MLARSLSRTLVRLLLLLLLVFVVRVDSPAEMATIFKRKPPPADRIQLRFAPSLRLFDGSSLIEVSHTQTTEPGTAQIWFHSALSESKFFSLV